MTKFALILYVIKDMVGDQQLAETGLGQLKAAFGAFAANEQKFPLFYESESHVFSSNWRAVANR